MGQIIDGKTLAAEIDKQTMTEVQKLKNQGVEPHLVVVLVGENPASQIYVRNKEKRANKLGIKSTLVTMNADISENELLLKIQELNQTEDVNAILVQMPLPKHIDAFKVTMAIDPRKDVDGFHPVNVGKLFEGKTQHTPIACTPQGIMEMFQKYHIDIQGKRAVVVGRSSIVGKPMAALLLNANATVTLAHSYTKDLAALTKEADILVVATGIAHFIKEDQVKEGAVVIDVGMDRDENGKLTGDVDFENVEKHVSYITPVPKGVGPMTISMLMKQTVNLTKWSI
ncbi:bifunctional 5,10-methylene-tetrahydrofolate dehydrogenase/5,10-methylene-tetrahydrofolate cyclohydrolase [Pediococcus pentosaceus]|jgi:methylenetetrahydrofolate dehydrogenase (NADP+)/methenyltetrahydrofolate cyclohydrolase|uniref:Bifunctional protein FolD n=1 Tax=Pediococcus pentosaceus TaxID=1255 RepID=A0A1Y0VPB5_PEDPE|nr:bifunctional methylenetetrahydrofolate dehydrogenase/methenyltetrahydrofolate cyclohydrolase FolD [Pediococcus pentosaceus]AHA04944.1 bifunctional 5,10-methylene-tetrahydrofolate dehydrogenase/ 5,10-methylene-tetrahydrofolate cyclohydrolase [Pediococcus pentosaceus SL4]ARW19982.1 Methylenetetrahydrofolate dehydrogenase (NADP(+)) [Pediococcus pentosaceus]KAF0506198.1 bifunctional methylenetetrahydrofolate dehydrogenase/methenyltetrahydrofolate cyclohydrolase FolD [Pediococcus pentosaceus]KAF0